MAIEIWETLLSPCAQRVRLGLAEKNLEWASHIINLPEKENFQPKYLSLNKKA
jgi:glutathione S-transferase